MEFIGNGRTAAPSALIASRREEARMRPIVVRPAHLAYVLAACLFGVLLYLEGWTWPLDAVAALLPVAGYLVFT